jgi:hypothetical protein
MTSDRDMTDLTALPWRVGRTLGRTVYARTGGDDYKADTEFGMLDTREIAARACADHNAVLGLGWLLAAGLEVTCAVWDNHGGPGYAVTLDVEDGAAGTNAEFEGHETLGEALAAAREWAQANGYAPC